MSIQYYATPPPTRWERIRSKMATLIPRLIQYVLHFIQYVLWSVYNLILNLILNLIGGLPSIIQFIMHRNPVSSLINWHYHPARRNISWFNWLAEAFITILFIGVAIFVLFVGVPVLFVFFFVYTPAFWIDKTTAKAISDYIYSVLAYIFSVFGE